MTKEEKTVIDIAIYLRYCIDAKTAGDPPRLGRLLDAIEALVYSCPRCNAGGHTCPGCGASVRHTEVACADCAPLVAGASLTRVDGTELDEMPRDTPKEWVPAQLGNVLAGDRMRLPGRVDSEATVEWARISEWNIKRGRDAEGNDAWWNDHYAPHAIVRVMMTGRNKSIEQPAKLPIEIEMDAERRAIFLTQAELGATKVNE